MALPACFHLADTVFPRVKAEAARCLVAGGQSQSATAAQLGLSQAMISNYVARTADDDPLVQKLAQELLQETSTNWCHLLGQTADNEPLNDLLRAEADLLRADAAWLVPAVGLNIARAPSNGSQPEDVLAYPARLMEADGHIVRPLPPRPGASTHLASCLLALRQRDASLHALVNVRGDLRPPPGCARMAGTGDRVAAFAAAVAKAATTPVFVHDPGAIGIEPCLYVAGATAQEAVARALLLR